MRKGKDIALWWIVPAAYHPASTFDWPLDAVGLRLHRKFWLLLGQSAEPLLELEAGLDLD
jgi:hypothetical protein